MTDEETRELEAAGKAGACSMYALSLLRIAQRLHRRNELLSARLATVEGSNAELIARMQRKDDYFAALTHDLKNGLTGNTKMLEQFAVGHISVEQQAGIFGKLLESNRFMLRTVLNFLQVYCHESGVLEPFYESVNVPKLVNDTLKEFYFRMRDKELVLCLDITKTLPPVRTDKILLRRVLSNLLDNAVKFAPQGGQLTVTSTCDTGQLFVSVKNTGPCLSDQQLKQIFLRYKQTTQGRRRDTGTGIGLFLSNQIMHVLGGRIECESIEQVGTTFTIILNMQPTPGRDKSYDADPPGESGRVSHD